MHSLEFIPKIKDPNAALNISFHKKKSKKETNNENEYG
jgi:hypothetical protein